MLKAIWRVGLDYINPYKVSQRPKTDAGAYAFSAFKSVIQTLVNRNSDFVVEACMSSAAPYRARLPLADPIKCGAS